MIWYAVLLGLGASGGLGNLAWQNARVRDGQKLLDASLIAMAGALICARIFFAVGNWTFFQTHLAEVPQIWLGGFSASGAITGGLIFTFLAGWILHKPAFELADCWTALLPPLIVFGWLAAWQSGVTYGVPVAGVWWTLPAPDEWGTVSGRFPLQLCAALVNLAALGVIDLLRSRLKPSGLAGGLALLTTALVLLGASFLRADPLLVWRGWRVDAWGALFSALLVSVFCAWTIVKYRMRGQRPNKI
jgi:phosphatidylglycerol---prolipoprotein diacylglyceryl transferase